MKAHSCTNSHTQTYRDTGHNLWLAVRAPELVGQKVAAYHVARGAWQGGRGCCGGSRGFAGVAEVPAGTGTTASVLGAFPKSSSTERHHIDRKVRSTVLWLFLFDLSRPWPRIAPCLQHSGAALGKCAHQIVRHHQDATRQRAQVPLAAVNSCVQLHQ